MTLVDTPFELLAVFALNGQVVQKPSPEVGATRLADFHIDVNARNKEGWTALHCVADSWGDHRDFVSLLLTGKGLDVNSTTREGLTDG